MDFKPSISEKFLVLFYKEIECNVSDTHSKLNLHILKIENNQYRSLGTSRVLFKRNSYCPIIPNKALHRTAIPLRFIAAGELGR